jgi:hypothetical protein
MKNFFKFIQNAVENVKEEAEKALENAQDLGQDLSGVLQKQMIEAQKQLEEAQKQMDEVSKNGETPNANESGLGGMLKGFLGSLENFNNENNNQNSQITSKVFKQIFKDLNEGEIIKFETPDGKFISSKNHFHCQGNYSDGSVETHYDIINNALQILNITYNNGKVTEVSHKLCEFSNIRITDSGWDYPRLHTDILGVAVFYTYESVPSYTYQIDSKDVKRVCYESSKDIALYTDKDPRNTFKIVEELILPNVSAEMQAIYHSPAAQAEREKQIAQKMEIIEAKKAEKALEITIENIKKERILDVAKLGEREIKGLKQNFEVFGEPKETSFITKTGKKIEFKGVLVAYRSDYSSETQDVWACYLHFTEASHETQIKLILTSVHYVKGKIECVCVETTDAYSLTGSPNGTYYSVDIQELSSFANITFKLGSVTMEKYNADETEDWTSTETEISINAVDLEDIYTIAGKISAYMNEYSRKDFCDYVLALKSGTYQEKTDEYEEESDNYQNNSYQNNKSSNTSNSSSKKEEKKQETKNNSSSSNAKAKNIAIKVKNDTGEEMNVYNAGSGGNYRLQKNIITTIKMDEGDKLLEYNNQKKGRVLLVAEPSMDGKVQLISKL